MKHEDVSVIICAYTEKRIEELFAAVQSVRQQAVQPREIIIVIDYNPSLLQQVRTHFADVTVIENREAKGASGSRNSGIAIAQGAVLIFLDDDAIAQPRWLEQLLIPYQEPLVVGVGGKIEPRWFEACPVWFPNEFLWVVGCTYTGMPMKKAAVRNVIGANMSVRRGAVMTVGGFRASFGNNKGEATTRNKWLQHHAGDEETELCMRITQTYPECIWFYTPSATVQHCVPAQRTRLSYFLWRCYDEGLGKALLVGLHDARTGLAAERSYMLKTLPRGIGYGLKETFLRGNLAGVVRAGAILLGLAATVAGYLVGRIAAPRKGHATAQPLASADTLQQQREHVRVSMRANR